MLCSKLRPSVGNTVEAAELAREITTYLYIFIPKLLFHFGRVVVLAQDLKRSSISTFKLFVDAVSTGWSSFITCHQSDYTQ
jgi:hypothetical protein